MRGGQIVAVILLEIRAFLFAHIDHVADSGDAHHVFERPHDGDPDFLRADAGNIGIIKRR